MNMRLTAVMLVVLVVVLAAEQEAQARKRGRARKCRRDKNKQWCNKEKVEDMIKDHPAVDKEKIKMAEKKKEQQSCPAGKIDLKDEDFRDVNERSLTPWVYVTNHSAASIRIPDTFVEAKCLCEGCLIYGPDGVSVENTKDYVNIPIKTGLPILERYDCRKGKCRERQVTYQVTVGCMCATRKRAKALIG